jgi:cytochrome c
MMDSFELTKIAGAVLAALLLMFAPRTFIDIMREGHNAPVANGFTLPKPAPATEAASGGAAAPAAFDPAKVVAMIATAKPDSGAQTFKKCLSCHTGDKTSPSKAGPNLWGIVGRPRASRSDFNGYSDAMKTKGGEWSYADLASFIHSPKTFVPGTKMAFAGVPDPQDLADLIAYLRTLSDSPPALP